MTVPFFFQVLWEDVWIGIKVHFKFLTSLLKRDYRTLLVFTRLGLSATFSVQQSIHKKSVTNKLNSLNKCCIMCFFFLYTVFTLPMLRLLSTKAQGCKSFWKPSKPCHDGIHWKALAEYSQMSTHVTGFQSFSFLGFSHHFVLGQISHQQHKG